MKKSKKPLSLAKETVVRLSDEQMRGVAGGIPGSGTRRCSLATNCISCVEEQCNYTDACG